MPTLVDYSDVLNRLTGQGFRSLYYNSGAFGLPEAADALSIGWVGPPDPTIRPAARALARQVAAPFERTLATLTCQVWLEALPGRIWLLPKSHWAYELEFGSHAWLGAALEASGLRRTSVDLLATRHDGSALSFEGEEYLQVETLLVALLTNLAGSDFQLVWPGRPVVCTIHHHKQVWWTSSNRAIFDLIGGFVPK